MNGQSRAQGPARQISTPQRDRAHFITPVFGDELEDIALKAEALAKLCRSFAKRPHVLGAAIRESIVNATAALHMRARSVVL